MSLKKFTTVKSYHKGFTLIELLVVISIIAILSTLGVLIFVNIQKDARNAARQSDVRAIIKALELNKTSMGYQPLYNNQFANSLPLTEPQGRPYCIIDDANPPNRPTWSPVNACSAANWLQIQEGLPLANTSVIRVCTYMENNTPPPIDNIFCLSSTQ